MKRETRKEAKQRRAAEREADAAAGRPVFYEGYEQLTIDHDGEAK